MTTPTRAAAERLRAIVDGNEFPDILTPYVLADIRTVLDTLPEWQPIESAPRDGTPILGASLGRIRIVSWRDSPGDPPSPRWMRFSRTVDEDYVDQPTHWMPLPAPPQPQQETNQ